MYFLFKIFRVHLKLLIFIVLLGIFICVTHSEKNISIEDLSQYIFLALKVTSKIEVGQEIIQKDLSLLPLNWYTQTGVCQNEVYDFFDFYRKK